MQSGREFAAVDQKLKAAEAKDGSDQSAENFRSQGDHGAVACGFDRHKNAEIDDQGKKVDRRKGQNAKFSVHR